MSLLAAKELSIFEKKVVVVATWSDSPDIFFDETLYFLRVGIGLSLVPLIPLEMIN